MSRERDALREAIGRTLDAAGLAHAWATDAEAGRPIGDGFALTLGEVRANGACTLIRTAMPSEGGRTTMNILDARLVDGGVPVGTWMWMERWARDLQRVRRRELALAAAGRGPDDPPAWSLCAHPGLVCLTSMLGVPMEEYVSGLTWRRSPIGFEATRGARADGHSEGHDLAMCGDVLWARRIVHAPSQWSDAGTIETSTDDQARPWTMRMQIIVKDTLPETAVVAAPGMDLADLIQIGDAPVRGATIRAISQTPSGDENQIDIELAPALAPIAEPPAGVRRDWLTDISTIEGTTR